MTSDNWNSRSTGIVLAVLLAACAGSPPPPAKPPENAVPVPVNDAVVITLARTPCLGWCPEYKVTITESGRVAYTGVSSVKLEGAATGSVSGATLRDLLAAFDAAGLAKYPAKLDGHTLDAPELDLAYRGKSIHYNPGVVLIGSPEQKQHDTINRLADMVDKAVEIERWIGTEAEREAAYDAERLRRARAVCERKPAAARKDCYEDHGVTPP